MTGHELRDRRIEADVSRGEIAVRLPALSSQMIQRIEEGLKAVPESYPADLARVLKEIGDERKAAAHRAAAKLIEREYRELTPAETVAVTA